MQKTGAEVGFYAVISARFLSGALDHAVGHALQEWCTGCGSATEYIPPGSPWENPCVESFNSRFRDEFLNTKPFASLPVA